MNSRDFDRAQELEHEQREASLAQHRDQRPSRRQIRVNGVVVCRSCYEQLSDERLRAHPDAATCVDCQRLYERYGI